MVCATFRAQIVRPTEFDWQTTDLEIGDDPPAPLISSFAFSPDGRELVGGSDQGKITLWNASSGGRIAVLDDVLPGSVSSLAFLPADPEGRFLVATAAGTIWLLDLDYNGEIAGRLLGGFDQEIASAAFSPDGSQIVAGSRQGTLWTFDATGLVPERMAILDEALWLGLSSTLSFSADSRHIRLDRSTPPPEFPGRSQATNALHKVIEAHKERFNPEAYSKEGSIANERFAGWTLGPDGTVCATAMGNGTVRLWDARCELHSGPLMTGGSSSIKAVGLSDEPRFAATVDGDGSVKLWNPNTGRLLGTLHGGKAATEWPGPASWVDLLCSKLTRNLSEDEWQDWVSEDLDYRQQCPDLLVPE